MSCRGGCKSHALVDSAIERNQIGSGESFAPEDEVFDGWVESNPRQPQRNRYPCPRRPLHGRSARSRRPLRSFRRRDETSPREPRRRAAARVRRSPRRCCQPPFPCHARLIGEASIAKRRAQDAGLGPARSCRRICDDSPHALAAARPTGLRRSRLTVWRHAKARWDRVARESLCPGRRRSSSRLYPVAGTPRRRRGWLKTRFCG